MTPADNRTEDHVIGIVDRNLEPERKAKRAALKGPEPFVKKAPSERAVRAYAKAKAQFDEASRLAAKAMRGVIVERRVKKRDAMTALLKAERAFW